MPPRSLAVLSIALHGADGLSIQLAIPSVRELTVALTYLCILCFVRVGGASGARAGGANLGGLVAVTLPGR